MAVATRKSSSELKKMARQRKKRKFKVKDPKRSRAMKKAWKSKRTKMLKGVKTRKRLYQSVDDFMNTFMETLEGFSNQFKWEDVSESEDEIKFESEGSKVSLSLTLTDDEKISVEVTSFEGEVLELFNIGLEHSEFILKGVFEAYGYSENENTDEDEED